MCWPSGENARRARQAVYDPRPAQVPYLRGDGLAVALAKKGDRDGRPVACMAVVPVHGNVSTLLMISKAARAYPTKATLGVFVSVITDCIVTSRERVMMEKRLAACRQNAYQGDAP
jgi:hypothetical protein